MSRIICGDCGGQGYTDMGRSACAICLGAGFETPELRAASDERHRLRVSLAEVRGWIDNWSPNFTQDEEWPETKARMDAALSF